MLDLSSAMAVTSNVLRFHWSNRSRRSLRGCLIGQLSCLILISPLLCPTLFGQSDRAMAQATDQSVLNNEELFTRYVKAAWETELERRRMMGEVKQLTGGNVPDNVCANLHKLSAEQRSTVQAICKDFSEFAAATITQKYQLSTQQFNTFQRRVGDPAMRQRINRKVQGLQLK